MSRHRGECDVCGKQGWLADTSVSGLETSACEPCMGQDETPEHEPHCPCQDCCDAMYVPDEQEMCDD